VTEEIEKRNSREEKRRRKEERDRGWRRLL
jgi:hypothetical protein